MSKNIIMKIEKRENYGRRDRNFHNKEQDVIMDKQQNNQDLGYWDLENDLSIYHQTDSHHPRNAKNPDDEQIINQDDAITNDEDQEEADQKLDYYDEEENDLYEEDEEQDLFRDADLSSQDDFKTD
jgi:hypothetical protein